MDEFHTHRDARAMRYRPSAIAVVVGLILGAVLSTAGPADATRNSAGQYSLPAGNPVVSGTTISSSWANNTLADLSVEMTNSLDRQGRGGMLAPLKLANGSASQPSISWTSDPDSGLYRAGANDVRMQVDGVQSQQWTSTGTTATGTFTAATTSTFTGAATFSAAAIVNGAATLNGVATANGVLNAAAGGPALALKPGTADHVYQEFYADTAAPSVRSGYIGYATAGTSEFTVTNSVAAGDMRFVTPGVIRADANVVLGAANPTPATAFTNTLTRKNVAKAWAKVVAVGSGSTSATVEEGFNVASATVSGNVLTVNLASAMSSTAYAVIATPSTRLVSCGAETGTTTSIVILCKDISGSTLPFPDYNFQATTNPGVARMHIVVYGAQ